MSEVELDTYNFSREPVETVFEAMAMFAIHGSTVSTTDARYAIGHKRLSNYLIWKLECEGLIRMNAEGNYVRREP